MPLCARLVNKIDKKISPASRFGSKKGGRFPFRETARKSPPARFRPQFDRLRGGGHRPHGGVPFLGGTMRVPPITHRPHVRGVPFTGGTMRVPPVASSARARLRSPLRLFLRRGYNLIHRRRRSAVLILSVDKLRSFHCPCARGRFGYAVP